MISIPPVHIESDLCTETNTFKQHDIQLDLALIRQTLCQQRSGHFVCSTSVWASILRTVCYTCMWIIQVKRLLLWVKLSGTCESWMSVTVT